MRLWIHSFERSKCGRLFDLKLKTLERRSYVEQQVRERNGVPGIGIFFVVGLMTTSHGADKVTVRMVAAWSKAAQFETQQFLSFIEMIQKDADQEISRPVGLRL